jgi:hypothetical protein
MTARQAEEREKTELYQQSYLHVAVLTAALSSFMPVVRNAYASSLISVAFCPAVCSTAPTPSSLPHCAPTSLLGSHRSMSMSLQWGGEMCSGMLRGRVE